MKHQLGVAVVNQYALKGVLLGAAFVLAGCAAQDAARDVADKAAGPQGRA